MGKPLILIDINEPHAQTAGAHFRDLRFKYGNPIVVMNLVKKREKRRHEGVEIEEALCRPRRACTLLELALPLGRV